MTGHLEVKQGVLFTVIAPGGFRILGSAEIVARKLGIVLRVTSACDGCHSGQLDPHHSGNAYDFGTKEFDERFKPVLLNALSSMLPVELFYVFLESPETENEHIHAQVRKNTVYPPA